MAKIKTAYFCQNCGHESPKWMGKCPSCEQWNTFVEEVQTTANPAVPAWKSDVPKTGTKGNKAAVLHEIEYQEEDRIQTSDQELNRVLGGGIVKGSLVLVGGEPGIG
jgi:DNA repair protein RadA/Sms